MASFGFMLDTNTVSALIRGRHPGLDERSSRASPGSLCISAITEGELRFGLARRPEATRLAGAVNAFLVRVEVRAFDGAAAARYGQVRAFLESSGAPLADLDTLIASHALAEEAVLVTSDRAFSRVPGLSVEDWLAA
jgi:tRNA(fMet)-specific endonuclease VapC